MAGRIRRASTLAVVGVAVSAAAMSSSVQATATSSPSAISKTCRALQAKAISAIAADPSGREPTSAERAYYARCPRQDAISVVSLGTLARHTLAADAKGRPAGIVKVTSSNPEVVALGKPAKEVVDGKVTNSTVLQAVGMGRSRVCFTLTTRATRCLLVVTPASIAGKAGGRTLNVAFGDGSNDAARVVSITSSDAGVVTVATDPSRALPYVVLGRPGTTTVCATYVKGSGGCQEWTIGP